MEGRRSAAEDPARVIVIQGGQHNYRASQGRPGQRELFEGMSTSRVLAVCCPCILQRKGSKKVSTTFDDDLSVGACKSLRTPRWVTSGQYFRGRLSDIYWFPPKKFTWAQTVRTVRTPEVTEFHRRGV